MGGHPDFSITPKKIALLTVSNALFRSIKPKIIGCCYSMLLFQDLYAYENHVACASF